ncbi:unnamed protein product [Paramecium octaurelia]|uniref:Uncharacterized protein n=1 Tax=Paramecium octaurelia TaxID=43137 RepID=A0A8S1YJR2_PAROT|nr:unnamed protein product [Paramecium octaurelia]
MKILYIILGYPINHSNSKCDELKYNNKQLATNSHNSVIFQKEMKKIINNFNTSILKLQKSHSKFHMKKTQFQQESSII